MMKIFSFDGVDAVYATEESSGRTSFVIVPGGMADRVSETTMLCGNRTEYGKRPPESMFQVAFSGDSPSRDFSAGMSFRNSETAGRMRVTDQKMRETETEKELVTTLFDEAGQVEAKQHLLQKKGASAIECWNEVTNVGKTSRMLEYLPSFSLSYISPFAAVNDPDKILMHRFRNYWSGEARKESLPVSHFAMEDSWSYFGYRMERFGQVGSMPARGFLPFVALEDLSEGVVWAATIEAPGSWQIEAGHRTCGLHLSGGLADYNFGHWRKELAPGESFSTHRAFLTSVKGSLLDACRALAEYGWSKILPPPGEEELPILYNEYLCTNGNPTMEEIRRQMPFCREAGVKYFVVDDGWFADKQKKRHHLGDWRADKERFPDGLKGFSEYAAANGMKAGVWYEFENVTEGAEVSARKDWMHTLDGNLIRHEDRIFPDFRKKEVTDYLTERVIGEIKESGIGYLKIDYNENIGMGVDGAESPGEGLRQHMENVLRFYRKIREECPDLVMEICSSGGMRHEPLFLSLGSMVSFSDLHFTPEAAVVACDLHYFMLPRQMQVWSYIHPSYSEERAIYAMAQGMLGRLCLSGDLAACPGNIRQIVREGTEFYRGITSVVRDGKTVAIHTEGITSLCNLHSSFSLLRLSEDGNKALFYAFRVRGKETSITSTLPGEYRVTGQYGRGRVSVDGNTVTVYPTETDTFATVVLLEKTNRTEERQ